MIKIILFANNTFVNVFEYFMIINKYFLFQISQIVICNSITVNCARKMVKLLNKIHASDITFFNSGFIAKIVHSRIARMLMRLILQKLILL